MNSDDDEVFGSRRNDERVSGVAARATVFRHELMSLVVHVTYQLCICKSVNKYE